MRVRLFSTCGLILLLTTSSLVSAETSESAPAPELSLREVRSYEVEDFDHPSLRRLKFPPDSELFASLEAQSTVLTRGSRPFLLVVPGQQARGLGRTVLLAEPVNFAFDGTGERFFLFEATKRELLELWQRPEGVIETARLSTSELGLAEPRGIAVTPDGRSLFVLDRASEIIVHLDLRGDPEAPQPVHLGNHRATTIPLEAQGLPELGGLAYEPANRRFLVLSSSLQVLYEFSDTGRLVKTHDLSELELVAPVRLLVAPSADLTDDPSVMHLYLADGGPEGEVIESRLREFSLSAPTRLPVSGAAAAVERLLWPR